MPVQYRFPKEDRPYYLLPAVWVVEALLLCVFLVMHVGFDVQEWSNEGERVNGIIVDRSVSLADSTDRYTATIRDVETGRHVELEVNSGDEVGDRVEVILLGGEVRRSGELEVYETVWSMALLGLMFWPLLLLVLWAIRDSDWPWERPIDE
jgi:hypothetical protein